MKKLALTALWVFALAALLALCWLVTLVMRWPDWAALALLVGALLAVWLARRLRRVWRNSVVRNRLALARAPGKHLRDDMDAAFNKGMRDLKHSSLGRLGGLYALPWVLLMGNAGSGKSALLARSRLASAMRVVDARHDDTPTTTLDWWFLEHAVVLDPAGRLFEPDPDAHASRNWQRLLTRLARTRRREPLNAVVLTLSFEQLIDPVLHGRPRTDFDALAADGQRARLRLDDLARLFDARIPVYVLLTRADRLPGFAEWIERVAAPAGLNAGHALGTTLPEPRDASAFVSEALAALIQQLEMCRLAAGKHGVNTGESLFMPESIAQFEASLRAYFVPAFNASPYTATPLLRGLFVSADVVNTQAPHNFTRPLFDRVIPADRDLWQPVARLGLWRRLFTHGALLAWFAFCAVVAALTVYSYFDARNVLTSLAENRRPTSQFSNSFAGRLASLSRDATTVEWLDNHNEAWRNRWLPFTFELDRVSRRLHANFGSDFRDHALLAGVDAAVKARIGEVNAHGSDALIAAYADLLVRRINLLDAALAGQSLDGLPLPGATLTPILADAYPQTNYDVAVDARFAQLYREYVQWQPDLSVLQTERETLRQQLGSLSLASRSHSWMISWADYHGDLTPVRAADLWRIADRPDLPRLSAAYTGRGRDAILAFIGELARASGNDAVWQERRLAFVNRYNLDQEAAWYEFIAVFPRSRDVLDGPDQWRTVLTLLSDNGGPYYRLLHRAAISLKRNDDHEPDQPADTQSGQVTNNPSAEASNLAPTNSDAAPDWVDLIVRLDRLLTAPVPTNSASPLTRPLAWLRNADSVGQAVARGSGNLATRYDGAKGDLALVGQITSYRGDLRTALDEVVKGSGFAYQQAADTYAFATDPSIKRASLIDAQRVFDKISATDPASAAWPVWALLRGPLDFTLDFVSRSAACTLQDEWNAQVLAPLQGANDPVDRDQLLFGSSGLIPTFMAGPAKPFVDRNVTRYTPRQVLSQSVPLNGVFYQYVSRAQVLRNTLASESVAALNRQKQDAQTSREREAEIAALGTQISTLQSRIGQLQTTAAVISLDAQPTQVTLGAKQAVQATTLSLHCASSNVELVNYNFPISRDFNWSLAQCGDTTLTVQFAQTTLTKRWPGPQGFIDFLRASRDGNLRLDLANFPQSRAALAPYGVNDVTVSYRETGAATLLAAFDELDRVRGQLDTLEKRRATLQAQAANLPDASLQTGVVPLPSGIPTGVLPPLPALLDETNAQLSLPTAIGSCWQGTSLAGSEVADDGGRAVAAEPKRAGRDAAEDRAATGPGAWAVRVGIFANPDLADTLLGKLGYQGKRERFQLRESDDKLWLVRVTGFGTRAQADEAAAKINAGLGLQSIVERLRLAGNDQ